tara:strand:+ start:149 stop:544 length:396 start_codon:yes stop_codon:yes gene_type:complete
MAFGTLKADTLTHSTAGSLATNYVVNGSAKAWAFYQQYTSNLINDSLNASGITDNAAGDATIAYTNNMSAAGKYATTTSGANGHVLASDAGRDDAATTSALTTSMRLQHASVGAAAQDGNHNSIAIFGDLA